MNLSFCAASVGVVMSEKFCSTTFFSSRFVMFYGVEAMIPNTVAPDLESKASSTSLQNTLLLVVFG